MKDWIKTILITIAIFFLIAVATFVFCVYLFAPTRFLGDGLLDIVDADYRIYSKENNYEAQ